MNELAQCKINDALRAHSIWKFTHDGRTRAREMNR
jgi:hypothetical protein